MTGSQDCITVHSNASIFYARKRMLARQKIITNQLDNPAVQNTFDKTIKYGYKCSNESYKVSNTLKHEQNEWNLCTNR